MDKHSKKEQDSPNEKKEDKGEEQGKKDQASNEFSERSATSDEERLNNEATKAANDTNELDKTW